MSRTTSDRPRRDARDPKIATIVNKAAVVPPTVPIPIAHSASPPHARPVSSVVSFTSSSLGPVEPLHLPVPRISIHHTSTTQHPAGLTPRSVASRGLPIAVPRGTHESLVVPGTVSAARSSSRDSQPSRTERISESRPDRHAPKASAKGDAAPRRWEAPSIPAKESGSSSKPRQNMVTDPVSRFDSCSPAPHEGPREFVIANSIEPPIIAVENPEPILEERRELTKAASTYSTVPSDVTWSDDEDSQPLRGKQLLQAAAAQRQGRVTARGLTPVPEATEADHSPLSLRYRRRTTGDAASHGTASQAGSTAYKTGTGKVSRSEGQQTRGTAPSVKRVGKHHHRLLETEWHSAAYNLAAMNLSRAAEGLPPWTPPSTATSTPMSTPVFRPAGHSSPPQQSRLSSSHSLVHGSSSPPEAAPPVPAGSAEGQSPPTVERDQAGRVFNGPNGRCQGTYLACHNCQAPRVDNDWNTIPSCYNCGEASRAVSRWRSNGEDCSIQPDRKFVRATCALCGFGRPYLGGKDCNKWYGLCFGCDRKVPLLHPRWFKDKKDWSWCCKTQHCRMERTEKDRYAQCPGCKLTPGVEMVGRHKKEKSTLAKAKAALLSSAAKMRHSLGKFQESS